MFLKIYTAVLIIFHFFYLGYSLAKIGGSPAPPSSWEDRSAYVIVTLIVLLPLVGRVMEWW